MVIGPEASVLASAVTRVPEFTVMKILCDVNIELQAHKRRIGIYCKIAINR